MARRIQREKYWPVGAVKVKEIQEYFLKTGDSMKNIASKFMISIGSAKSITDAALKEFGDKDYENKQ